MSTLMLSLLGSALVIAGVAAVTFGTSDQIIANSFNRALAEAPAPLEAGKRSTNVKPASFRLEKNSERYWLQTKPVQAGSFARSFRIGDRITIDGGQGKQRLHVIRTDRLSLPGARTPGTKPAVWVMVTAHVIAGVRQGQRVRFIVEQPSGPTPTASTTLSDGTL
ncbi:MAG: hypothetical protein AAFR04_06045 [Pseudomonadota bacterium]